MSTAPLADPKSTPPPAPVQEEPAPAKDPEIPKPPDTLPARRPSKRQGGKFDVARRMTPPAVLRVPTLGRFRGEPSECRLLDLNGIGTSRHTAVVRYAG